MTSVVTAQVDLTSGQPTEQRQVDGGALVVQIPCDRSTCSPLNATTTAYAASLVIKASEGTLYYVSGFNSKNAEQFILFFDSAALPANGAVPKIVYRVDARADFDFPLDHFGRHFRNGIVVSNSSTGPTLTIGSADCWFDAQYL